MNKRKDRREFMESHLSKLSAKVERVPAIVPQPYQLYGKAGKYHYLLDKLSPNNQYFWFRNKENIPRSMGALGCYLSHYNLYKKCLEHGESFIVLEDDFYITQKTLDTINGSLPPDDEWDVIRDNWFINSEKFVDKPQFCSKFAKPDRKHHDFGGTHIVMINGRSIQKVLDYLDKEYFFDIDGVLLTDQLNVWLKNISHPQGSFSWGTDIPKTIQK